MAKDKISDYSSTANSNTDIAGINIDEGCAPSGINDAIRTLMAQLKTWQSGGQDVYIHPAGTALAPSVTVNGDTNTGIFFPAADTVGISTGGTERARVDSSGNLLVGTSTQPSEGQARQTLATSSSTYLQLARTSTTVGGALIGTTGQNFIVQTYTGAIGSETYTERARIDASGNFLVGTTSATYSASGRGVIEVGGSSTAIAALKVNGSGAGYFYHDGTNLSNWNLINGALIFGTNNTERARIDSSGNLLIGLTSAFNGTTSPLQVGNNAANQTLSLRNANATPYGQYIFYSGASPNNTANEFLYCSDTTAQRFTARSNGGLANYSGNNVNLSDRREKTNFAPAKSYLDTICAIPVQTFNYIDQNMEEDPGLTLGVVAQDVQAVAPELVSESNWGTKEEPKMRLSIYQTDLQYALMKCIQEQQAIITQLQADVAALKGQA